MKKLLIICAMYLNYTGTTQAQTAVKLNNAGKYEIVKAEKDSTKIKDTGKKLLIKDIEYTIYESVKGKHFIKRISKEGKEYKQYIKL